MQAAVELESHYRRANHRDLVRQRCANDSAMQQSMMDLCADDLLFWVNTFVYLLEPRNVDDDEGRVLPFDTYPFQDEGFRKMEAVFGKKPMIVKKTRGVGLTWMMAALFTHRILFRDWIMLGVCSREEKLVDGGPKSFFHKVHFILQRLPQWMCKPSDYERTFCNLVHRKTHSSLEGTTTTGSMFRGDRYTSVLWDEMADIEPSMGERALASVNGASRCRYMPSTPQGEFGVFYKMWQQYKKGKIAGWEAMWWDHPVMNQGMTLRQGKRWSPYYQQECDGLGNIPNLIASELDGDFVGSGQPFFTPIEKLEAIIQGDAHEAFITGSLIAANQNRGATTTAAFVQGAGDLLLWTWLKDDKPPSGESYAIGVDVSWGVGSTNSVASIVDRRTGEKVGEYATPSIAPGDFAGQIWLLALFFNHAYLLIESNGPGLEVIKKLIEIGYTNMFYRRDEEDINFKEKTKPGWAATPKNQLLVYGQYKAALYDGRFINHSLEALEECKQYQFLPGNRVGNKTIKVEHDRSGATAHHGDRVTADALACKAILDEPPFLQETPENYTVNSEHYDIRTKAGRDQWHRNQKKLAETW